MARLKDREKALALRKQGMSYSQIKQILGIHKSTLSSWLRDYPLSEERIRQLRGNNEQRIEKFRETMRKKRKKRLEKIYVDQKKLIFPIGDKQLFLAGLFLYWGEGTKCRPDGLSISNTDPGLIKFFIFWLNKSLLVPPNKIKVYLQLYSNMNVKEEIRYWSRELRVPLKQFARPYIKQSSSKRINHKGSFGHGTCNIRINNVVVAEKIFMGIKAISDFYQ